MQRFREAASSIGRAPVTPRDLLEVKPPGEDTLCVSLSFAGWRVAALVYMAVELGKQLTGVA